MVDARSLGRAVLFAAASVLAFALAFGLLSDRMPTALARIFSPFADIPPASGVIYTVEPGDAKVLRGEDVTFAVKVGVGASRTGSSSKNRSPREEGATNGMT